MDERPRGEQLDRSKTADPSEQEPIRIELRCDPGASQSREKARVGIVRITNISDRTIWMVGAVPGSEGLRYPLYLIEIEGPEGPERSRLPEDLDYVRGLRVEDFVQLAPGEGFDPQGKGFIQIQQLAWFRPSMPGRYRLRLCFDATEPDLRCWMGHTRGPDQRRIEELIKLVPQVKVWSNSLELDFDQGPTGAQTSRTTNRAQPQGAGLCHG
jgi:hypothetical protein